jgi:DNA-binding NarL/FixJ family response regulator
MFEHRHQAGAAFRRRWLSATCTGRRNHQHVRRTLLPQLAVVAPRTLPGGPLTARECEVAVLIAHGLTNRQIAQRLVIALRTADNHVQHIFDKLGVWSRAQVAAWVVVNGMLGTELLSRRGA